MRLKLSPHHPVVIAAAFAAVVISLVGACGDVGDSARECLGSCKGCCQGSVCMAGSADNACGPRGSACNLCALGQSCQAGVCSQAGTCLNCSNGCCLGGLCQPGTLPAACGNSGQSCATCKQGERCANGFCEPDVINPTCNPYNCNGCCLNSRCIESPTKSRCGVDGSACVECKGARQCDGGACSFPSGQLFSVCVHRVVANCLQSQRCDDDGPDLAVALVVDGSFFGEKLTKELKNVPVKDGLAEGKWVSDCPLKGVTYQELTEKGILVEVLDVDLTVNAQLAECVVKFVDKRIDVGEPWAVSDCHAIVPALEISAVAE